MRDRLRQLLGLDVVRNAEGGAGESMADAAAAAAAAGGGEGAAAGGEKPAGGAGAGEQQPAGEQAGDRAGDQGGKPAAYYPEGLPEDLRGATDAETIDKLLRRDQERPRPPEKADGYTFDVPKELQGLIDPANDSVLPLYREIAHELGLTQDQFHGTITKLYAKMQEAGLMQPPVDPKAELAKLSNGIGDPAEQVRRGAERFMGLRDQVNALATRQLIEADQAKALIEQIGDTQTFLAIEKLISLLPAERGLQNGGSAAGDSADPAAVQQKQLQKMYPSMKVA